MSAADFSGARVSTWKKQGAHEPRCGSELMAEIEKINNFYLLKENEFKIQFTRKYEGEVTNLVRSNGHRRRAVPH